MWNLEALEDACTFISRGISPMYREKGGVLVLNQKCVRNHLIDYSLARRHDIDKKNVKSERFIKKGDVLINSTGQGTLGRIAQVRTEPPEPTIVDSHVTIVRPNLEKFYLDYFGYALIQIEDELKKSGQGASGQTELAKTRVQKEFFVSYPSNKSKQESIVTKIDTAFAEIDKAIEQVEAKQAEAERLKASLLGISIRGDAVMWKTVKLGEVLELQNGYAFKSKEYSQDGFFVMRITNVQQGYISAHNPKYIQIASASKLTKFILEEGDILVSLTGDIGRVGVIREEHLPAALNQRVARVQSVDASLDSRFLFHYLNSAIFRNQVEALGKGAAQANVSTKEILEITLELPPLTEQQRIVAKLDAAFAEIEIILATTSKSKENYSFLKSAILAQELQPPQSEAA